MVGKDFQTELVCATWKAVFSPALIDSDSLNPSRPYPLHFIGSRFAHFVETLNPMWLDVYTCMKGGRGLPQAGQGAEWKVASGASFSSTGFGSFGEGVLPEFAAPWKLTLRLSE